VFVPILSRARNHLDRTAVIDEGRRYAYATLLDAAQRVAVNLVTLRGGRHLDEARVAFQLAPGFDYIAIQWGIWLAGGVAVPLPMSHPPAELEYFVRDSDAAFVIGNDDSAATLSPIAGECGAEFLKSDQALRDAPDTAPDALHQNQTPRPSARAMILYTSGTTNRPKGVVTTHGNIAAQVESLVAAWEWSSQDRTLLVLPLHHVHGIINVVSSALWVGATLETLPRFDAEAAWARLASGELTVFSAVPTIYHRLIQSWESASAEEQRARSAACRSMRLMMCGSAALPRSVLDRWRDISGHVLLERYGMTEVGMALSNPLHGERRPGSVGAPLPGVSLRLVDGEVQLKGPGVFSEYWRRPEATADSFVDGWFRTGDLAVIEEGAYRLLGRSSVDIIKSGGDKISALEIEDVLRAHPAIRECAVVGVDDLEWGQRVCCAVELTPGQQLDIDELRTWARPRLAPHKIPKDLRCVDQLPRNALGKIVKPRLSAIFAPPVPPARPGS